MHINYEFKARTNCLSDLEKKLNTLSPRFVGTDNQVDTYFNVPKGRLKLREGNIENSLIFYNRSDDPSAKISEVELYRHSASMDLKNLLTKAHGVKVVVAKQRKIYFIDNIKFHFDTLPELGTFVEVEAIDFEGTFTIEQLRKQCNRFIAFFDIQTDDFIEKSYSDLLLA